MPRFPSAQGRLNHEPDPILAVTKTCPKGWGPPLSSLDFVSQQRDIHNYVVARHATLLLQNRVSPREGSVKSRNRGQWPRSSVASLA